MEEGDRKVKVVKKKGFPKGKTSADKEKEKPGENSDLNSSEQPSTTPEVPTGPPKAPEVTEKRVTRNRNRSSAGSAGSASRSSISSLILESELLNLDKDSPQPPPPPPPVKRRSRGSSKVKVKEEPTELPPPEEEEVANVNLEDSTTSEDKESSKVDQVDPIGDLTIPGPSSAEEAKDPATEEPFSINTIQLSAPEPKIIQKGDKVIKSYVDDSTGRITCFETGIKLEVRDANPEKKDTWYPAKVAQIDHPERKVLVHFNNWSPRFDEWLSMDDPRIRPSEATNIVKFQFKVGEKVECCYKGLGAVRYEAKITSVLPNDYYGVEFYDGIKMKRIRHNQIFKLADPEEAPPSLEAPPPAPPTISTPSMISKIKAEVTETPQMSTPHATASQSLPQPATPSSTTPLTPSEESPGSSRVGKRKRNIHNYSLLLKTNTRGTYASSDEDIKPARKRGYKRSEAAVEVPVDQSLVSTPGAVEGTAESLQAPTPNKGKPGRKSRPKVPTPPPPVAPAPKQAYHPGDRVGKGWRKGWRKDPVTGEFRKIVDFKVKDGKKEANPPHQRTHRKSKPKETSSDFDYGDAEEDEDSLTIAEPSQPMEDQDYEEEEELPDLADLPPQSGPSTSTASTTNYTSIRKRRFYKNRSPITPSNPNILHIPPAPRSGYRLNRLILRIQDVNPTNMAQIIHDPEGIIFQLDDPTPDGWSKEATIKVRDLPHPKWFITYVSPAGDKFRYRKRMEAAIQEPGFDFSQFDFRPLNPKLQKIGKILSGGSYKYKRRSNMPPPELLTSLEDSPAPKATPGDPQAPSPASTITEYSPQKPTLEPEMAHTPLDPGTPQAKDSGFIDGQGNVLIIEPNPDGGWTCPAQHCRKLFRKDNLLQMHLKHYHPELQSKGKIVNVVQMAQARSVFEYNESQQHAHICVPNCVHGPLGAPPMLTPEGLEAPQGQEPPVKRARIRASTSTSTELVHTPLEAPPRTPKSTRRRSNSKEEAVPPPVKSEVVVDDKIVVELNSFEGREDVRAFETKESLPKSRSRRKESLGTRPDLSDDFFLNESMPIVSLKQLDPSELKSIENRKRGRPRRGSGVLEEGEIEMGVGLERGKVPLGGARKRGGDSLCVEKRDSLLNGLPGSILSKLQAQLFKKGVGKKLKSVRSDVKVWIINCICGGKEEFGLMIQCELCHCWQHGICFGIDDEMQLPKYYICDSCKIPSELKRGQKYDYSQELLKNGRLPRFSFGPNPAPGVEKEIKECFGLLGKLCSIREDLRSAKLRLKLAQEVDHPKLYHWDKKPGDPLAAAQTEAFERMYGPIIKRLLRKHRGEPGFIEEIKNRIRRAKASEVGDSKSSQPLELNVAAPELEERPSSPSLLGPVQMEPLQSVISGQEGSNMDIGSVKMEIGGVVEGPGVSESEGLGSEVSAGGGLGSGLEESGGLGPGEVGGGPEELNFNVASTSASGIPNSELQIADMARDLVDTFKKNPEDFMKTFGMESLANPEPEMVEDSDLNLANFLEGFGEGGVEPEPPLSRGPELPERITAEICKSNLLSSLRMDQDVVDRELGEIERRAKEISKAEELDKTPEEKRIDKYKLFILMENLGVLKDIVESQ